MKLSYLSIAALAGTVAAQVPGLPTCAQSCVVIPPSCGRADIKCICTSQQFLTSISCCVAQSCDAADQAATIKFADSFCGTVGVTNLPQSATCASTAGSSSTATGSASSSTASSLVTSTSSSSAVVLSGTHTSTAVTASASKSTASSAASSSLVTSSAVVSASPSTNATSHSTSKAAAPVVGPTNVAFAGAFAAFALLA